MSVHPGAGDNGVNNHGSFNQEEPFNIVLNEISLGKKPIRVKPQ